MIILSVPKRYTIICIDASVKVLILFLSNKSAHQNTSKLLHSISWIIMSTIIKKRHSNIADENTIMKIRIYKYQISNI